MQIEVDYRKMAPPGRAEPQLKRPGEGAKERKLHGVRRERMKGRSSREGGSSRQSILMRKLKRRSELRRQLLAKEVREEAVKLCFFVWKLLIFLKSSSTCKVVLIGVHYLEYGIDTTGVEI